MPLLIPDPAKLDPDVPQAPSGVSGDVVREIRGLSVDPTTRGPTPASRSGARR
jgi:hypothetical protein